MAQVDCLDLQIAESGHHFREWNSLLRSKNIEQARNILLNVKRDLEGLEPNVFDAPQVFQAIVCNLLEVVDLVNEVTHLTFGLIE
jgi:hypothetical protein